MRITKKGGRVLNSLEDINKDVNKAIDRGIKNWLKTAPKKLMKAIVDTILRGMSPIEGEGKFEPYSDSYKDAIRKGKYPGKRVTPVNLKLSGEMLKSIYYKVRDWGFNIGFSKMVTSRSGTLNLAEIHTDIGAGKSKTIRKILPTKKQGFKKSITNEIDKDLGNSLTKELNKI